MNCWSNSTIKNKFPQYRIVRLRGWPQNWILIDRWKQYAHLIAMTGIIPGTCIYGEIIVMFIGYTSTQKKLSFLACIGIEKWNIFSATIWCYPWCIWKLHHIKENSFHKKRVKILWRLKDILYTPYISCTDIFAVLDCLENFARVKFHDFCDVFITVHSHILK